VSPAGNLYASTIVRLRPSDPPAATLALVAAVALEEVVRFQLDRHPRESGDPSPAVSARRGGGEVGARFRGDDGLALKWPNDLLLGGAKLSGILLERAEDAVVIGFGVNLAYHPDDTHRVATSLAVHGIAVEAAPFLDMLAETFARWLTRWRAEGIAPIRDRWVERAHPAGTALTARLPDGSSIDGLFERLDGDGALILRLASGERRVIHAGDVFLI
jgi:BirA family biotin operon repressor/biotin-[acetyl-CoA-carboxylase] ligase